MTPRSYLALTVCLLLTAACSSQKTAPSASKAAAPVVYSANGWSAAERAEFYHLAEGSELMPYALLANIVSVKTGKPFLQQMERFGFVADPPGSSNPHGLPIGITTARSRNGGTTGIEVAGFNCAACHVA